MILALIFGVVLGLLGLFRNWAWLIRLAFMVAGLTLLGSGLYAEWLKHHGSILLAASVLCFVVAAVLVVGTVYVWWRDSRPLPEDQGED
jgi:hypothetical protein